MFGTFVKFILTPTDSAAYNVMKVILIDVSRHLHSVTHGHTLRNKRVPLTGIGAIRLLNLATRLQNLSSFSDS